MPRSDEGSDASPRTRVVGEDWYGRDLTGAEYRRVGFVDVDLTEATGHGAVFEDCTFAGVRFNASVHTEAAFVGCRFTRCSFFDARFERSKLVGSTFDGCEFDVLRVEGGNWSFVTLTSADLRSARITGTRMREADLGRANLAGATLRDCDLSGAFWEGADLSGADLRGSDLSSIDPLTVTLRGALVGIDQAVVVAEALGLDVRPDDGGQG